MGRRYDDKRWVQNEDGSFTRKSALVVEEEPLATPAAAELAEELEVDIKTIKGSGKDGKVTKADVEAVADSD